MDRLVLKNKCYNNSKTSVSPIAFRQVNEKYFGGGISIPINIISNSKADNLKYNLPRAEVLETPKLLIEDRLFPLELHKIQEEIEASKYILDLEEDWDYQGAERINREVYDGSISFLTKHALYLYTRFGVVIEAPEINPCRDGTIDLSWRTTKCRMLINFRVTDKGIAAFFYGDNYNNNNPVKGTVPSNKLSSFLAEWMKELQ